MTLVDAALPPVGERITGAATLGRMILSASERGEDVALRYPADGSQATITYGELGERARAIARGLIALGIERGDVVSILCGTRAEWTVLEAGALCAGAVIAPIYPTNSPEECRHVLSHAEARLVFCEDEPQVTKVLAVADSCPALEHVVTLEDRVEGVLALGKVIEAGSNVDPEEVERRVREVEPSDVASLVYTSGTTGPPKGCALTHANFLAATAMYLSQLELDEVQPVVYMFLPLAHVLARIAQVVVLDIGGTIVYWGRDPQRIVEEIAASEPTHFFAVPRIFEKLHSGVLAAVAERGAPARIAFAWALEVGRRARTVERAGSKLSPVSALRLRLADRIALAKVRALFGPRAQMALVGAAPIDRQLLEFFDACRMPVYEGYGLTESCATCTLNPPGLPRYGTVGRAFPGSEVMVAEDGEVLIRGPQVFAGYHRDRAATDEVLQHGWLRTGDLGSLSPDGYLTIVGRKKDLIITSGGKNITPVSIESALRETRWIDEAVVYGDRRPYLVCMLTLDPDEAPKLAADLDIPDDLATMAHDARVHERLQAEVDEVNARFARVEQIKRFGVLDHDLTEAAGELTATLKVKRQVVYDRYAEFFDALYAESAIGAPS